MSKSAKAVQSKTIAFKLLVPAAKAAPTPPVGPALGQRGVKSIDFCKQFNDATKHIVPGTPIPTRITVKPDRSFSFITKAPQTAWLLMRAAGIEKGSATSGKDMQASVSVKHIYEIAKIKSNDPGFKGLELEKVAKCIAAQTRSLGIKVVL
ncbi:ribosomal protein L11 [Gonapodya prolifera JEL478]|uniref:Large ribosomal subunit protein uL11m n=1 Tax=Gonapodya prolifera (strain JEL478) TaxID=1344416 RepID=A0A138ZXJ5_GONPJ|nr:ribosomal protein L11 [Gonapodya prolifera JEL478]|eukprot:KXS09218.1 ribosomal protein L11 [Gonapodya prolifera JEL478]